jgi:redox-sensitive bicupin YhaK (pirin superfamily)
MKAIAEVRRNVRSHWVGDGFPVRSLFSYQDDTAAYDPFLLLDYAGPHVFAPASAPRGVGEHPHRGFETVTIVYEGELEHRDSSGSHGVIGAGDVQWMTAAAGLVHAEFHSQRFTAEGGTLEMVQLWVNLPAANKQARPGYQEIVAAQIPTVALPGGGTGRVIAGELAGARGPAKTFTPIAAWDVRLPAGKQATLSVPEGHTALLVFQKGRGRVNGAAMQGVELVRFDRAGTEIVIEAEEDTTLLVLSGQPIGEPVVAHGPFVMNTREEIRQAMLDYQNGKLGSL